MAHVIVDAISERLGSDIVVWDMDGVSLLADYFVLCNAESTPQFRAILDEITGPGQQGSTPRVTSFK